MNALHFKTASISLFERPSAAVGDKEGMHLGQSLYLELNHALEEKRTFYETEHCEPEAGTPVWLRNEEITETQQ